MIQADTPTGVRDELARDVFLLSFMLIGMNSADLFACDKIVGDRIVYYRQKTATRRSDRAEIQIDVLPVATALFQKYRDATGERVFNFHHLYLNKGGLNEALNKGLKRVVKNINAKLDPSQQALALEDLQFYAARHSWATIARNDCRIEQYTVHATLNHVDASMEITDIYIAKEWSLINDANRVVLDYVLGK